MYQPGVSSCYSSLHDTSADRFVNPSCLGETAADGPVQTVRCRRSRADGPVQTVRCRRSGADGPVQTVALPVGNYRADTWRPCHPAKSDGLISCSPVWVNEPPSHRPHIPRVLWTTTTPTRLRRGHYTIFPYSSRYILPTMMLHAIVCASLAFAGTGARSHTLTRWTIIIAHVARVRRSSPIRPVNHEV